MTTKQRGYAFVLKWEGSKYTNHPEDRGGPTKYGITQKTYNAYRMTAGRPTQSVRFIVLEEVYAIMDQRFWVRGRCPEIEAFAPRVAIAHLDAVINHGHGGPDKGSEGANEKLQRAIAVPDDGVFGPRTMATLGARCSVQGDVYVLSRYLREREKFYHRLSARQLADMRARWDATPVGPRPAKPPFLGGWINRLVDLARELEIYWTPNPN